jgi:hypothetical protein
MARRARQEAPGRGGGLNAQSSGRQPPRSPGPIQPVPSVTEADLARVLEREFPGAARSKAGAVLAGYGRETWHREPTRVKLAILKLAQGDLARLEEFTKVASTDYRDVLAWAEYPAYFKAPKPERDAAIERDWSQYVRWLTDGRT